MGARFFVAMMTDILIVTGTSYCSMRKHFAKLVPLPILTLVYNTRTDAESAQKENMQQAPAGFLTLPANRGSGLMS
jgi:hypothetical protein